MEENDFDSLKRAGTDAMRAVGDAFSAIDFSAVTKSVGEAVEDIGQAIASLGKDTTSPYVIADPEASGRATRRIAGGIFLILLVAMPLALTGIYCLMLFPIAALVIFIIAGVVLHAASRSISKARHERFFEDKLCHIDRVLGMREAIPVAELAKRVHMPAAQLLAVLDEAIGRGLIPEGRLGFEGATQMLYLSAVAAHKAEAQGGPQDAAQKKAPSAPRGAKGGVLPAMEDLPDEAREVLSSAAASVGKIREAAAKVRDSEVRKELEDICSKTEQTSVYLMHHPESASQFRRAATYYLPTTAKLAASYAELEEHGSGAHVEKTLEDLRSSFKEMDSALSKLADELVLDQSMDVRSDIEVMRTMLRQDGLSDE